MVPLTLSRLWLWQRGGRCCSCSKHMSFKVQMTIWNSQPFKQLTVFAVRFNCSESNQSPLQDLSPSDDSFKGQMAVEQFEQAHANEMSKLTSNLYIKGYFKGKSVIFHTIMLWLIICNSRWRSSLNDNGQNRTWSWATVRSRSLQRKYINLSKNIYISQYQC